MYIRNWQEAERQYDRMANENQELEEKVADLQEQLESTAYMLTELLRARGMQGDNDISLCQKATAEMGEDDVVDLILQRETNCAIAA